MMTNVLIIEDDPMVAELNRTFVESIPNMNVIESFRNVEEGKKYFRQKNADLLLLRQQGNDIPVILITAADDIETIKNVIRYGALDYLIKPFTLQRFQLAIEKYLAFSQTIQTTEKADQKLIDQVFNHTTPIHEIPSFIDLPKGLSKLTLKKISAFILKEDTIFSTKELAQKSSLSRISVKKYLNFLVEQDILNERIKYLEIGRPLTCYELTKNGRKKLTDYC